MILNSKRNPRLVAGKVLSVALVSGLMLVGLTGCGDKKIKLIPKPTEVKFDIDYPVGQITKDVTVSQSFISNCNRVTDIMLYGATYTRQNTATINVDLLLGDKDSNELIAQWTIDSSQMADNEVITFYIEEGNESVAMLTQYDEAKNSNLMGKNMLIRISSEDGEPELSPTFWMTEENVYEDGCLNVAGYDQYNDLWFQVEGE